MPCQKNLVEDLAAQYTTYKATELTFVDWIRLHPVVTVWVLLIFGWLLTAMAGIMVRLSAEKAQKAAQEKVREMYGTGRACTDCKQGKKQHFYAYVP